MNKKNTIEELEVKLKQANDLNTQLLVENGALKSENGVLRNQVKFFEGLFAKQQDHSMNFNKEKNIEESVVINGENDIEFLGLSRKNSTSSMFGMFAMICIFSVICVASNSYFSEGAVNNGAIGLKHHKDSCSVFYYILHPYMAIAVLSLYCGYISLGDKIKPCIKKLMKKMPFHNKLN